jgi:hypothetical protein
VTPLARALCVALVFAACVGPSDDNSLYGCGGIPSPSSSLADAGSTGDAGVDNCPLDNDKTEDAGSAHLRILPCACDASASSFPCESTMDEIYGMRNMHSIDCQTSPESCDFASEGCPVVGCIRDFTLMYTFAKPTSIGRIRYRSDWWNKRPRNWQLWASDDETLAPGTGATLVTSGIGHVNPWVCVAGDSCAPDEVPDLCCPDGRAQPQVPPNDFESLWDEQRFPSARGRVWWFRVQDTYEPNQMLLGEVELMGAAPASAHSDDVRTALRILDRRLPD